MTPVQYPTGTAAPIEDPMAAHLRDQVHWGTSFWNQSLIRHFPGNFTSLTLPASGFCVPLAVTLKNSMNVPATILRLLDGPSLILWVIRSYVAAVLGGMVLTQ